MRIITRSDFDGLVSGALLEALGIADEWLFVHPKDIQDGFIEATKNDVVVNVPYIPGCGLWFDHHSSEDERLQAGIKFEGAAKPAPSCARVIYDYYGGDAKISRYSEMVRYADKMDSAALSEDEIRHPSGWVLLGFITDPRTGLGRFHNFKISNLDLMKKIARIIKEKTIDEILAMPDVQERIDVYFEQNEHYLKMVKEAGRVDGSAIIVDLRGRDTIYAGNRFLLYTIFPAQNISVWIVDGKKGVNSVITTGYSVINKTAKVDVGSLMLKYGGGGHKQVGTCQVADGDADRIIKEIIAAVR
jgi:nanoRNase/pAp phosphatase (c-di-AMP/oligoRNAs hydrolase)